MCKIVTAQFFGKEHFIAVGNTKLCVVAIVFQGCCPLRTEGFNQSVLPEVRSIWSGVYILGDPPSAGPVL